MRALRGEDRRHLRARQAEHGGWPLYHGGDFDLSCTVKAYYALKLAGDDPRCAAHAQARAAILQRGGAATGQCVHAHRAGAVRRSCRGAACPTFPSRSCCCRSGFRFTRQGVLLVAHRDGAAVHPVHAQAGGQESAQRGHPRAVHDAARKGARIISGVPGLLAKAFLVVDRLGRMIDPLIPARMRERATRRAESWMLERLNGEDGLGAIFPAMVNALEAMVILGYPADDPRRVTAKRALQKLSGGGSRRAPIASPASRRSGIRRSRRWRCRRPAMQPRRDASMRALDWLQTQAVARRTRRLAREPAPASGRRRLGISIRE